MSGWQRLQARMARRVAFERFVQTTVERWRGEWVVLLPPWRMREVGDGN